MGLSDEAGAILPDAADLDIFLAPSHRAADEARGPRDARLTRFGHLRVDQRGAGRFRGTVPNIAPGGYVAVAYCGGCSPASTFTVGEFTVSGAKLPMTGSSLLRLVSLAILLLAGGLLAWFPTASHRRDRS